MVVIRNGEEIHFKKGQYVRIRQWNDMAAEFQVNKKVTEIKCEAVFIMDMLHLCGEVAEILSINEWENRVKLQFNNNVGKTGFYYSIDMIEPI